jgi:Fe-S cluster biogenesis protein NfuA
LEGSHETLIKVCREVLGPLVRADGGILYLVSSAPTAVHLHLAGTCAGCPGASITREAVLEPAVRAVFPKVTLKVTTGFTIPEGAEKM